MSDATSRQTRSPAQGDTVLATTPGSEFTALDTAAPYGGDPGAPSDTRSLDLTKQPDGAALWDRPRTIAPEPPAPRRRGLALAVAAAAVLLLAGALVALRGPRGDAASSAEARAAPPAPAAVPSLPSAAETAPAAPERPAAAAAPSDVEVVRGDTLWRLSAEHLGDPLLWPRVHDANRAAIADPDLIFPGQRLRMPPAPATAR
jgi:hypothetical protein